jgi:glyoxylase-like metal-dependent hydrolase (beta-lactamase superfamily II)
MLQNRTWQPLPGTSAAWIYPYIRRPDILSSNSYLIRTPAELVLIDAGALPEQAAELWRVVMECGGGTALPLIIFLTHCHLDHCLQAPFYQDISDMPVWIAVHARGAEALANMDSKATAADLYGLTMPRMTPELSLFPARNNAWPGPRRIRLPRGGTMTMDMRPWTALPGDPEDGASRLVVTLAGGDRLEVYSTPGHSPDSVCIRIGAVLFIGDLLAAAYPLVAGICGWNRDLQIHSLDRIIHLLDTEPIHYCCPAHGGLFDTEKTRSLLLRARSQTIGLTGREEVNPELVFQVMDLALELVDEAEEVFSAMAGRLLYVAHHLDALEEPEAAQRCREVLPMERIDACLAELRTLCQGLESGRFPKLYFTSEALALVGKINHCFDSQRLIAILPENLVHQAGCLLLDFLAVARSTRNVEEYIPTDLSALLTDLDTAWRFSPHQEPSILECGDDQERCLAELIRRIGHPPPAQRTRLVLDLAAAPLVRVAAARLNDTLVQFLEWVSLTKPAFITLATSGGLPSGTGCDAQLRIIPAGWSNPSTPRIAKKIATFTRRLHIAGMTLHLEPDGFLLTPLSALV